MASDKTNLIIHTSQPQSCESQAKPTAARFVQTGKRMTMQERLLRNSCIACAILLGILAVGNMQQPWAKKASGTIEKALTMEIDLDKSLGQLSFVQKLMPESTHVFFNLSGKTELLAPIDGTLVHPYSADQPWLMFNTPQSCNIYAPADGVVSAVSPLANGGYGVLIDHGEGLESVLACLSAVDVQAGASVSRGEGIGESDGDLYFELREAGKSVDPTERMGL